MTLTEPSEPVVDSATAPSVSFAEETRKATTVRAVGIVVHRYVGLAMAVFLVIAGVTGSLIVFFHELDAGLNPRLFRAPPPSTDARPLDPFRLREVVASRLPSGLHISNVSFEHKPGEATRVWTTVAPGADLTGVDDEYFVDPYSGKILGSRKWADLGQGMKNLMPFFYRLHYSLALGKVGAYLFGVIALLWTIDCFIGAYLTFPLRRRKDVPSNGRSWLARWKPSWLVRANKLFSFVFTWHRASGLWVWAMLLVFAWSSVGLNLKEVYNPVMKAAFSMDKRVWERLPKLALPRSTPELSFREAHAVGRELMAIEAAQRGFEIHDERRLGYDAKHGTYDYQVRSSLDISDRYPGTTVWFDGNTGEPVAFEAPTGQAVGNAITSWLYHLHWGSIAAGGWLYRVFVSLMGLAITVLSVTGVWIWWKKRKSRKGRKHRTGGHRLDRASMDQPSAGPGPRATQRKLG
jgi:uncharacterized iron-regulated membrane protein